MILDAEGLLGRVTFVTGAEKGCGKTAVLNYALGLLRVRGERAAFLGIGYDGDAAAAWRAPRIACRPGEVFVTAASFLASCGCLPEVLEVLPGSTPLGKLVVVRAGRNGHAVLVGADRHQATVQAVSRVLAEGWARTVLVDGAINRITQVSAFDGAQFLFAVRASPGDLGRNATAVRRLAMLARLPAVGAPSPLGLDHDVAAAGLPVPACAVAGPLTAETYARVPGAARTVVVDDFTKVFLDLGGLRAALAARALAVRTAVQFAGFVVALRDVSRHRFLAALADPCAADLVAFNPYEVEQTEAGRASA